MGNAIGDLEAAGANFREFTDSWFVFLTAFKSTYTTLEQGAKVSAQSRQWFGAKARERRGDELLQYLFQARNDEEHGLEAGAEPVPGRITVEVKIPDSLRLDLSYIQTAGGEARLPNGTAAKIHEHILPSIILAPVRDRDRSTIYRPPVSHLGAPLADKSPLGVAKIGFGYLVGMVKEAEVLK